MDNVRKNEIAAVILFAVTLFLFLSLFTFTGHDLSLYTSNPNSISHNMTGVLGAYLGALLLFVVGKAAYVFPALTFIWGVSRLFQIQPKKFFFKTFGTIFLVAAVSASLSLISYSSRSLAFERGGFVGTTVSEFLVQYLGKVGTALFIFATIVLSLLIATEFLILPMLISSYRFLRRVFDRARSSIPEGVKIPLPVPAKSTRKEEKLKLKEAKEEIARKLETIKKQVEEARKVSSVGKKDAVKTGILAVGQSASGTKKEDIKISGAKETPLVKVKPAARVAPVADGATGALVDYKLPGLELIKSPIKSGEKEKEEVLKMKAALLENTLAEFGVSAKVVKINRGPVITMYELEPAEGTRVAKITSLGDNISLAMKSSNIRIVAPLPGKGTIGVEVPNDKSELVLLKDIIQTEEYQKEDSPLKLAIGKDISGTPLVLDLTAMPHLLIAGTTGSGKTVCINCIISSLLFNCTPEELKFLMVDPKRVELMMFEGIPHLLSPIVTNAKKVSGALSWVIGEMERRYDVFAKRGVRNLTSYKEKAEKDWEKLPYIVVIIDELADLMVVAQQEIEGSIMRLAQLSRAAGIHMILATQRPSVNVITGVIKANFPARISFKVASKVDSKVVLDTNGAEKLLGRGDLLIVEPGRSDLVRGQCGYVEDNEIRNIVKHIKSQAGPQYVEAVAEKQEKRSSGSDTDKDDLYKEAVDLVIQYKQASVSLIQRKLRVGYSRAARLIDIMEEEGIVGPYNGAKPREILVEDADGLKEESKQ